MEAEFSIVVKLLAALGAGLLIGIERGWSGQQKEEERVAGIRTFSLIGLLGGVWAILSTHVGDWIVALAFFAIAALAIASYIVDARYSEDRGTTTAYTQMMTFALGAWAAFGYYMYALGVAVVVVALLGMKPVLHKWLRGLETQEIYAGIKMLVISLILLPLLPNQGYGPWEAINPRWIWWMVVLISGISFLGYFAIKYSGDRVGTLLTSITGGLASSTAVTLSMSNFARKHGVRSVFMGGVMIASSIMFIRIMIEVAIVNPVLLDRLVLPMVVMFGAVLAGGFWLWNRKEDDQGPTSLKINNPFNIGTALKFGLFLGLILFLSTAMQEWFGDRGIYILAIVSGLMDVDAITLSLSRLSRDELSEEVAIFGIMLGAVTNTLTKGFLFAFFAGFKDSLRLIGLMLLAVVLGLSVAALTLF